MEHFYVNGQDLPNAAFQVLADALSTPAFASLDSLAVPTALPVACCASGRRWRAFGRDNIWRLRPAKRGINSAAVKP